MKYDITVLFEIPGMQEAYEALSAEDRALLDGPDGPKHITLLRPTQIHPQVDTYRPVLVLEQPSPAEGIPPRRRRLVFDRLPDAEAVLRNILKVIPACLERGPHPYLTVALLPSNDGLIVGGVLSPWRAAPAKTDLAKINLNDLDFGVPL